MCKVWGSCRHVIMCANKTRSAVLLVSFIIFLRPSAQLWPAAFSHWWRISPEIVNAYGLSVCLALDYQQMQPWCNFPSSSGENYSKNNFNIYNRKLQFECRYLCLVKHKQDATHCKTNNVTPIDSTEATVYSILKTFIWYIFFRVTAEILSNVKTYCAVYFTW